MSQTKSRPQVGQIFTTGAFCAPSKWVNPDTGKEQWCWVVSEFTDDSYMDGNYVTPAEKADTADKLMNETENQN